MGKTGPSFRSVSFDATPFRADRGPARIDYCRRSGASEPRDPSRHENAGCAMNAFSTLPHDAPASDEDRVVLLTEPGFGRVFTDHMVTIRYTERRCWYDATLGPRGPVSLDPAAAGASRAGNLRGAEGLSSARRRGRQLLPRRQCASSPSPWSLRRLSRSF